MNAKVIGLSVVLVGFLSLTAAVVLEYGYIGFFDWAMLNSATRLLMTDLVITLALFLYWMNGDARARGVPMLPYAIVTLLFGAAGPLAYLIHRELSTTLAPSGT